MNRLTFMGKINGNETLLEGIVTYRDDELNKDFIVYTDKKINKDGQLNVYFSLYKIVNNNIELVEVNTQEERRVGLMLIKEIISDLNHNN